MADILDFKIPPKKQKPESQWRDYYDLPPHMQDALRNAVMVRHYEGQLQAMQPEQRLALLGEAFEQWVMKMANSNVEDWAPNERWTLVSFMANRDKGILPDPAPPAA
jgi:hypothetical protein